METPISTREHRNENFGYTLPALAALTVTALTAKAWAPPDFIKVEIKTTKVGSNLYTFEGQGGPEHLYREIATVLVQTRVGFGTNPADLSFQVWSLAFNMGPEPFMETEPLRWTDLPAENLTIVRATRLWVQYGIFGFAVFCIIVGAVESLFGR